MDTENRTQIKSRNIVDLDSIGVIPPEDQIKTVSTSYKRLSPYEKSLQFLKGAGSKVKELLERLKFEEHISFSSVDDVVQYLQKRQNIFTFALEASMREKETTSATMTAVPQSFYLMKHQLAV